MDTIPDSIYFKDTESRFLRVTKSMVPKFNATEYSQIIGKTDFDFFAREHAKQAYDDEQEIIRIGKPLINVIEKETWEDGSISWVSSTKMPLRDSTGRIVGTFGISKDITSIKQMENELTEHNNALSAQKEELQQTLQQLQTTQSEMQVLKELETKKQKEMLETIDNNRRMLMKVIDNVPGKIFLKDNEGKIMLVNTEMAKTYGMSAEELIGKTDFDFYTETDAKRRKEAENEIISGGRKTFIETEEIAGEKHYYRTTLMPFFIAHLNQKGILSVQADITEIKTMEIEMKRRNEELHAQDEELRQTLEEIQATNEELERLKEADARHNKEMMEKIETHRKTLFDIIDHIPGKIFLKDSKSRMVLVNSLVAKVHGVKAEELIGKDDFDFFDKEIAQGLFDEEQSIIRGGKPKSYIQTEDLSGEARVLHTTKMPFYINYLGETGLLGVQTDITDIKRQEDEIVRQNELMKELQNELSAENAMFQTLMENIPEQITFKDLKGSYKRINKSKAKAIGLSEVSDAKNKTDFDFLDKKLAQKLARDDKRILKWGESMYNEEDRITLADGTTQWTATTKVPYSLNTGEIEGVIEIVRDISETKIAKAEVWTKDKLISGLAMKLPSLVFNLDKGGEITKIFGGALKSLKFKEKDLIGKSITEIYPKLADKLAKGLKNEEFKFSTDMEGKHFESVVFDNEITELISGYSVEI